MFNSGSCIIYARKQLRLRVPDSTPSLQMSNEYADMLDEAIDKLKRHLNKYRAVGNLLAESRICSMIGRKYTELAGRDTRSNSNAKRAKAYFRAQMEISESIGDASGQAEGIVGIGLVYERQGRYWRALEMYEKTIQTEQVACSIAHVKFQMGLQTENALIREHLFGEALELLPPVLTTESLLIQTRIWHEMGKRDFNWDMPRQCLRHAQEYSKTWLDKCKVDGHKALIAEQKCLQACNRSYDQRRQVSIDAWNDALESFDRQLFRAKEMFDREDTPSKDRVDVCEQMAQAYRNLATAQSHIGDLELAHTTLCLLRDFVRLNVADPVWTLDVQRMLSDLLFKQRAVRLVNQSSTFVSIEEWVNALLVLEMYEDAGKVLDDKIKSWEGDKRRLCWAYRKLIEISNKLGQDGRDCKRQLTLLLPENEEKAVLLLDISETMDEYMHSAERIIKRLEKERCKCTEVTLLYLAKQYEYEQSPSAKNECLGLFTAFGASMEPVSSEGDEEFSYFANRKPSKTLQRLVGTNMVMKSKKRGEGLNLKVKRNRRSITAKPSKRAFPRKPCEEGDSDFVCSGEDADDYYTPRNLNSHQLDDFVVIDDHSEDDEAAAPMDGMTEPSDSFSNTPLPSHTQQSNADTAGSLAVNKDVPSVTSERIRPKQTMTAIAQNSTAYAPKHVRVIVQCGPHSLLLPCIDDDIASRKTIAWLKAEIKKRCLDMYQSSPDITRLLTNGVVLFEGDAVTEVLGDEQRVECKVAAWYTSSPLEQYGRREELVMSSVKARLLTAAAEGGSVDLSCLDLVYDHDHLKHLLACLSQCHSIDLSENKLDDRALNLISLVLLNSPDSRLQHLDLSGNMIRGEGLPDFVSSLGTKVTVDLSFNPLLPTVPSHPCIKAEYLF